eukprot:2888421-Prymnesium_polylepis.1
MAQGPRAPSARPSWKPGGRGEAVSIPYRGGCEYVTGNGRSRVSYRAAMRAAAFQRAAAVA